MYVSVNFVDMSKTIYVQRSLWQKNTDLRMILDYSVDNWSVDKILVNGGSISEQDLDRKISSFNTSRTILGEYEVEIEKTK